MPDIKIKGWSGTDFQYQGVPKIWLDAPESTEEAPVLVPYTYGEAVSKTVEPDFSAGDMAVDIQDGELVSELTIAKPETLIPENIAEGVNIAGILGTFVGGSEDAKNIAYGTFRADRSGKNQISHGLDNMPDLFILWCRSVANNYNGQDAYLSCALGVSARLQGKLQVEYPQWCAYGSSLSVTCGNSNYSMPIDGTDSSRPISNSDAISVTCGTGVSKTMLGSGLTYYWIAICDLA